MSNIEYIPLYDFIQENPDKIEQIKRQYLLLLSHLTSTDYLETSIFLRNISSICDMGSIIVGINNISTDDFEIIASGTIIIEPKIIRKGKNVGHIEDIVVAPHMRGKNISQKILNTLKYLASAYNCYKVTLDCSEEVNNVYIKNGFEFKGIQMTQYFV